MKPITSPMQKDMDSSFQTKSALYMYQVIPNELNLIKKYDNTRAQLKKNNCDKFLNEIFRDVSALVEVKLIIKLEQLESEMKTVEMNHINKSKKLIAIPSVGPEKEEFENIAF